MKIKLYYEKNKEVSKKRTLHPPHLAVCWMPPARSGMKLTMSLPGLLTPVQKHSPPPNSIPPTELRGSAGHPDACVRTPRNTMPKMNSVPGLVMMGGNVMQSRLLPLAYKFSTGGMNIFLSLAVWEHTPGTGSLELYIFKVSTCALPSQEGQPISSYLEPWNCQVRDIVLTHIGETSRKPIFSSTAGGSQKWHNLPVESFGKMYLTLISTSKHSFSNEARDKTQRMFIKYYL